MLDAGHAAGHSAKRAVQTVQLESG